MYDSGTYKYMQAKTIQNDILAQAQHNAIVKEAKAANGTRSLRTNIGLSLIKLGQKVARTPRLQEA